MVIRDEWADVLAKRIRTIATIPLTAHNSELSRGARLLLTELGRYPRYWRRLAGNPDMVEIHGIELEVGEWLPDSVRSQLLSERYERGEARCLLRRVRASDVVMEIGGGLGFLSALAARLVGCSTVFTYEANPDLIPRMRRTHRLNGVQPYVQNAVLGQGAGATTFYVEDEFTCSSTHRRSVKARPLQVPRLDVNEEIARTSASFLIMDIEGGELELVPAIDWDPIRAIVIELHPEVIGPDGAFAIETRLRTEGLVKDRRVSSTNKLYMRRSDR